MPGQIIFCLGQNQICPIQNKFVKDKIFFVQDKNFVHGLKIIFAFGKLVSCHGQNFCLGQKIFCPGQNYFVEDKSYFVPDKNLFVQADGRGIRLHPFEIFIHTFHLWMKSADEKVINHFFHE